MQTITLTLKEKPELYLEADSITPDSFAGKNPAEIAALPVYEGNRQYPLGDLFKIEGTPGSTAEDTRIIVKGDLKKVKWIGSRMTAGEIEVQGDMDMYAGAFMEGGSITVKGSTDGYAGIGMKGGELTITGDTGVYLGAAYRGDWRGMKGGIIRVGGNAGSDIGMYMRGGEIIVGGDADVHVGTHQEGGRIIVKGNAKSKVGGQLVEGEIFVYGNIDVMMPGFVYREDIELEVDGETGKFAMYDGDLGERHPKRKGETVYGKLYLKY